MGERASIERQMKRNEDKIDSEDRRSWERNNTIVEMNKSTCLVFKKEGTWWCLGKCV